MDLPPGPRLSFEDQPSWEDREVVDDGLGEYNKAFFRDPTFAYFGIFVRDDAGAIRAGLIGHVYAGWLFVNCCGCTRNCVAAASAGGSWRKPSSVPWPWAAIRPGSTPFRFRGPISIPNSAIANSPGSPIRQTISGSF
jgi:hypothetical protein